MKIWEVATQKEKLSTPAMVDVLNTLIFSPDGKVVTVGGDMGVQDPRALQQPAGHDLFLGPVALQCVSRCEVLIDKRQSSGSPNSE